MRPGVVLQTMRAIALVGLLAACLCNTVASTAPQAARKTARPSMLNARWVINLPSPAEPDLDDSSFLPPGSLVRIVVSGPTRQAIEENRNDQLGGSLILLPPFPPGACKARAFVGSCKDMVPIRPDQNIELDATFTFSRWTPAESQDVANETLVEHGAREGAPFVLIVAREVAAEWQLWLKGPNELVGQYLAVAGSRNPLVVPQIWRKATP